ncbi:MAG: hypothetical protein COA90_00600 [Gammaproteobacteria bacterium]|nr:MAG: hypothetical protein COA90_00600 [Gammaproteobacteria bacterium]
MSVQLITLLACAVSFTCLVYLRNRDPKRRRVFRLAVWDKKRYPTLAWLLCFIPGVVLLYIEQYSAFIMWLAALSLIGWTVALPKPKV